MIRFDVNELRDMESSLEYLRNIDDNYVFYYDETNNSRKFHIRKGRFNTSPKENFILGGVVHLEKSKNIDVSNLFTSLKLQKTVKEVKFKNIAKCNSFIECLKSIKLKKCLQWLSDSQLYIHYNSLNIWYFSIVDIVDSAIIASGTKNINRYFVDKIKNDLYLLLTKELEQTKKLFFEYNYPNINKNKIKGFINKLLEIVYPYRNNINLGISINSLIQMLQLSKKANILPFIMDEKDHILIDSFSNIFIGPLYIFKNSFHFFDNEEVIRNILDRYEFIDRGSVIRHYKFVDSKEYALIQLSDIIVGLLGKYFHFIRSTSKDNIKLIIDSLNSHSYENLKLLNNLILKSSNMSNGFIFNVTSMDELSKQEYIVSL